jgi:hypothetical protein
MLKMQTAFGISECDYLLLHRKIFFSSGLYKRQSLIKALLLSLRLLFNCQFIGKRNIEIKSNPVNLVYLLDGKNHNINNVNEILRIIGYNQNISIFSMQDIRLNLLKTLHILLKLFQIIISYSFFDNNGKKLCDTVLFSYVQAMIIVHFVTDVKPERIIFHGWSYNISSSLACMFLTNRFGLATSFFIASPICDYRDCLRADEIIFNNKWQKCFLDIEPPIFIFKSYRIAKIENYYSIPSFTGKNGNYRRNNVAIYSSGIYNRDLLDFDNKENLGEWKKSELSLKRFIIEYAKKRTNLSFHLFLHPHAETKESALIFYESFLKLPNVMLAEGHHRSMVRFDEFEIGIGNFSMTLFERLDKGHKSLFLFSNAIMSSFLKTSLSYIIQDNPSFDKIDQFRQMDHKEYFKTIDYSEVLNG